MTGATKAVSPMRGRNRATFWPSGQNREPAIILSIAGGCEMSRARQAMILGRLLSCRAASLIRPGQTCSIRFRMRAEPQ